MNALTTGAAVSLGELLLDALGFDPGSEFVSLCYEAADGSWHTEVVTPAAAVVDFQTIPPTADVFHGVNPIKGSLPKGHRGAEADITRLSGLWVDLDVKGAGSCPTLDVAKAIVANLSLKLSTPDPDDPSVMVPTRPTILLYSGSGLHAYWPLKDGHIVGGDVAWARALLRRWHRLVKAVAADLNVTKVDSVYDLPRVLRTPGSFNNKEVKAFNANGSTNGQAPPVAPLVTAERQPGRPLTVAEVETCLDRVGVSELPEDRTAAGTQQVSAPKDWQWAPSTCGYMIKTITAWENETPTIGRHPWLMSCYVRIAAAHRNGCLTEADYQRAQRVVNERFDWLTRNTDPKRQPRQYEISGTATSALEWGIVKAAAHTDVQIAAELGRHSHSAASKPRPQNTAFWEHSDELRLVRDWARSRLVSPWATLGTVLVRIVVTIPTTVQIYPYVGREASLNLFLGLVGLPGLGKGGPEGTARDALITDDIYMTGPGLAEGLNHLFAHYEKQGNKTVFDRHAAYFTVPEVDTLAGLGSRNGSTLLPQLCKAWSGESLTFAYADPTKRLDIPAHSYRLGMVVGIQPERAGALFDAADSGVPQRFVWLPTDDPDVPDTDVPEPGRLNRTAIATQWDRNKPTILELPKPAADIVKAVRRKQLRGKTVDASLDGHLPLCRTKLAVALMLLHDERTITMDHWDLAGEVIDVSNDTRERVQDQLAAKSLREVKHQGRRDGVRAVEAAEVKTAAAVKSTASSIVNYLGANGGDCAWSQVRKKGVTSVNRDHFAAALASLVTASQVEVVSSARGKRVKLVAP